MQLSRDSNGEGPSISGIIGRGFRVDGGVYEGLAITPERAEGWAPPPLEQLSVDDLSIAMTLDPPPMFILLGTGTRMVRPPSALIAALDRLGIGIDYMDSRAAARAWGVLRGELRWISAALYPLD